MSNGNVDVTDILRELVVVLGHLLVNHTKLVTGAAKDADGLRTDLQLLKFKHRDYTTNTTAPAHNLIIAADVRKVIDQAEDVVDAFVAYVAANQSKSRFARKIIAWFTAGAIADKIKSVRLEIKKLNGETIPLPPTDPAPGLSQEPTTSDISDDINAGAGNPENLRNIVGLKDESEKIIRYLCEDTMKPGIISITGMPGIGKTMLARKIFHDNKGIIARELPTRIWVHTPRAFKWRAVYLQILKQLNTTAQTVWDNSSSDDELRHTVWDNLNDRKFLIVLDDVWTDDWDRIQLGLEPCQTNSKVLITSRHLSKAKNSREFRHYSLNLQPLNSEDSWKLLQYEVFHRLDECPPELRVHGKLIAEQCSGLPMAIVAIGGVLSTVVGQEHYTISTKSEKWGQESEKLYNNFTSTNTVVGKKIECSYVSLPDHLKACFLYLLIFPKNSEIRVQKLIRMWIAEGFIPEENDAEKTAETYLEDLIERNLVMVSTRKYDGRVKTCCIHGVLHDFCKNKAATAAENFLHEIVEIRSDQQEQLLFRRVCIHSNVLDFISSRRHYPRVRSLACFSDEDITLVADKKSAIPKSFKMLRLLDVEPIKFMKFPDDMRNLVHLRYVVLSLNSAALPASLAKLWNIQTLIVDTPSRTIEIKLDIWKLAQLRHLEISASANLPKVTRKCRSEGDNLRTLGTISPECCRTDVFDRAQKLKELSIRGQLSLLMNNDAQSFSRMARLNHLEKLELFNDPFPKPPSEDRMCCLPQPNQFPGNLKSLTLSKTFLDWTQMRNLGLLSTLVELKLKERAFMGRCWVTDSGGFESLEFLHIGHTNLVHWEASSHRHFPKLHCLELHNCGKLQEIPAALADVKAFRRLDLYHSRHAAISAKKIQEAKKNTEFRLSISPPEEAFLALA